MFIVVVAELISKLRKVIRDDKELAKLDNAMKSDTNKLTSAVLDACLPHGLVIFLCFSPFCFFLSRFSLFFFSCAAETQIPLEPHVAHDPVWSEGK